MTLSFGIQIILILLIVGGAVAITGDYIGRIVGRKHFRIFNLRPRYTAYAITTLTGIIIVSITLLSLLAVSQDARTALFGMEKIRSELKAKAVEIEKSRQEILDLEKTKSQLKQAIALSRKTKVLFQVGDSLLSSLIKAGPEREKLEKGLKQILSAADNYVRSLGLTRQQFLIFIAPEDFNKAVATLQQAEEENIVIVRVKQNTLLGEEVPVYFDILENKSIYKAGTAIAQTTISPILSTSEIEIAIKQLLAETHASAKQAGIIPDPAGTIGKVSYAQIYTLARKIKSYPTTVVVKTIAKKNTYAIGPLEIDFSISNAQ